MSSVITAVSPSPTDCAILAGIANGTPCTVIGRRYGVGLSAVTMRMARLRAPLGLPTVLALIAVAVREGWIVWDGRIWLPRADGIVG